MKKRILLLFLLMDLMIVSAQYGTIVYNIPAAGQTVTIAPTMINNTFITLGTRGNVNLASNTYTLTYSALPANGVSWRVKMDFRKLTQASSGANITIFGVKPLQAHPDVDTFDITYTVIPDSVGTKYLYYIYNNLTDAGVFNANTVFNGTVTFNGRVNNNDTTKFYGGNTYLAPTSAITTGRAVVAGDTAGKMTWGCAPWCVTGNSGLTAGTNFLGTTDAVDLVFKVNNIEAGRLGAVTASNTSFGLASLLAATAGNGNSAFGYTSLYQCTSGTGNVALGSQTLKNCTTGENNSAVGLNALGNVIDGISNTAIGAEAGGSITTGDYNVCLGASAGDAIITGNSNIAIGLNANAATSSSSKAIAIGENATASANQLAIAGIRSISLPNVTSAVRYTLTDTSGLGDFIPQPYPINAQTYYTSVTGDSITPTTSSNLINPAGTLANLTVRLPASPYSGQLLEFSSTQIITSLHWSVALNQAVTAAATLPSSMSAGGTIKIQYNSNTATWYNW